MSKGPKFDADGYEKHPFGKKAKFGKPVKDFLPPPHKLRLKVPVDQIEPVDVWVPLSKRSANYFKRKAKQQNADYRVLIARFVEEHLPTR